MANNKGWGPAAQQLGILILGIAGGSVLTTIITRTNIVDQLLSPARSIWMSRTDDSQKLEAQEIIRENTMAKKGFSSEELIAKGVDDMARTPSASYRI